MRKLFKVSTKVAVFNRDKTKVLVIHMDKNNDYGLPGGHIDEGEDIEVAVRRELAEECGIDEIELAKTDFFLHSNGKLILAFVGQLNDHEELASQQSEQEGIPRWLTKDKFEALAIEPNYKRLVLDNWS
jgi:8-oxo-dGTP diphosphatase